MLNLDLNNIFLMIFIFVFYTVIFLVFVNISNNYVSSCEKILKDNLGVLIKGKLVGYREEIRIGFFDKITKLIYPIFEFELNGETVRFESKKIWTQQEVDIIKIDSLFYLYVNQVNKEIIQIIDLVGQKEEKQIKNRVRILNEENRMKVNVLFWITVLKLMVVVIIFFIISLLIACLISPEISISVLFDSVVQLIK